MLVDHGQLHHRMLLQLFKMWSVVSSVDAVQYDPCPTDVILRTGEDVGPALYKSRRTSSMLVGQIIWQPIE